MRKKILLLSVFCLCTASFAMAEGMEVQFGVGYHATFFRQSPESENSQFPDDPDMNTTINIKNTPFGVGAYMGIGYGIGSSQDFSFGLETALSWSMSLGSSAVSNLGLQGRIFTKYGPSDSEDFSITGFGGFKSSVLIGREVFPPALNVNPVFGIRTTVSYFYLEYAVVVEKKFANIYAHDIGLGILIHND